MKQKNISSSFHESNAKELYSTDILKFAAAVVWYSEPKSTVKRQNFFLLHMMRTTSETLYQHAKKYFHYTDDDFRTALLNASAGIIMYQDVWDYWNERLDINPPLPMPKKIFFSQMSDDELKKLMS